MPTYEYHCTNCQCVEEIFHGISQEPLTTCPACGRETLQRGIGGCKATLHFRGEGFYITDYAGKKENPSSAAEKKN